MKKLIILMLLSLVCNNALAIEDLVEEDKKSSWYDWYNPEKDKIAIIDGKRCISRFTEGVTKPVCNRDVMAVLNKFQHALISNDFDALMKLLKFPLGWGSYGGGRGGISIKSPKELKNTKLYKRIFTSCFKTVVLLATLDDTLVRTNEGSIELVKDLIYLEGLHIQELTLISPGIITAVMERKLKEMQSKDRNIGFKNFEKKEESH